MQCSSDVNANKCPTGLVPLREVLTALDNPKLECHDVDPKFTKDDKGTIIAQQYDIKANKKCAVTPGKVIKDDKKGMGECCKLLVPGISYQELGHVHQGAQERQSGRQESLQAPEQQSNSRHEPCEAWPLRQEAGEGRCGHNQALGLGAVFSVHGLSKPWSFSLNIIFLAR